MGKYDDPYCAISESVPNDGSRDNMILETLLLGIANELAEANKLKRLEIELKVSLNREELGTELDYFRSVTEDKA